MVSPVRFVPLFTTPPSSLFTSMMLAMCLCQSLTQAWCCHVSNDHQQQLTSQRPCLRVNNKLSVTVHAVHASSLCVQALLMRSRLRSAAWKPPWPTSQPVLLQQLQHRQCPQVSPNNCSWQRRPQQLLVAIQASQVPCAGKPQKLPVVIHTSAGRSQLQGCRGA
jgi:hypothetical protein